MGSIGGGKRPSPILIAQTLDNDKVNCSYMGVSGIFHTIPTRSEMAKINKIMKKYKVKELTYDKYYDQD